MKEGKEFISRQLQAMHAKLGTGEVELSQYIAFCELCARALKVIEALEEQLDTKGDE
jgi:hypothetical protein